jgi:hypothetical protein
LDHKYGPWNSNHSIVLILMDRFIRRHHGTRLFLPWD